MTSTTHRSAAERAGPVANSTLLQVVLVVVVSLIISLAVKTFAVQLFEVPSTSMVPTLMVGDRIVVERWGGLTRPNGPHRGDVVVFADPGGWLPGTPPPAAGPTASALRLVGLGPPVRGRLVKRVIGIGGDRVQCCDAAGRLQVDGIPLAETYLAPGIAPSLQPFDVTVPPGSLWLMGDNRPASADSRAHMNQPGGGFVPLALVVGKVDAVAWPLGRARLVLGNP